MQLHCFPGVAGTKPALGMQSAQQTVVPVAMGGGGGASQSNVDEWSDDGSDDGNGNGNRSTAAGTGTGTGNRAETEQTISCPHYHNQ